MATTYIRRAMAFSMATAIVAANLVPALALGHSHRLNTNGPFVVGGTCSYAQGTVTFNQGGIVISATNQQFGGTSEAGWEVFDSHPGVNPGNIIPTPSNTAPTGTYSFSVSGLPSSSTFLEVATRDALGGHTFVSGKPITNGAVSIVAPAIADPSSTLVAVYFWIYTSTKTPLGTITVTNLKVNGQALGIDTTHFDDNSKQTFSWCNSF